MSRPRRSIGPVLGLLLLAAPLSAQGVHVAVSALGAGVRLRSVIPSLAEEFTGPAFGLDGGVAIGRFGLELGYTEGTLTASAGSAPSRDLVDGKAFVAVQPFDWFTVKVGPHVRSYVVGGTTQRWVLWEARARVDGALVGPVVEGYAELWRAFSANVNLPAPFDHAQGGEIGMTVHPGRGPLRARVGYLIDYAQLSGGARVETVETLLIAAGVELR